MTEAVAAEVTPAAAPAATPASPASAPPAEVVVTDGQKPAESATAPAPENAKPDKTTDDPQDKRTGTRRFERRIAQAIRRAAEARAEADLYKKQLDELKPKEPVDAGAPRLEQFDDIEKYADAKAKYAEKKALEKAEAERQTKAQREEQEQLVASWEQKAARAEAKYDDFDEVVGDMKPTSPMFAAIMDAENGEDIAYHLGKNLDEAKRILAMPPWKQIREIGKLETKLAAEPAKPKTPSKAPAPITPISGTKAGEANEIRDGMDFKSFVKVRNRQLGRVSK